MPLVSVIVPIYNAGVYLRQCLDSIIGQNFKNIEILIINDGSTDSSPTICDEYAQLDRRVRVFHKPNGGVSSARNLGLDNAKGEWVIFCDSDDYWCDVSFLNIMVEMTISNNLDIVRGEYISVDEDLEIKEISNRNAKNALVNKILSPSEFLIGAINGEFFLVLSLIRRDLIDSIRFDENMIFLEDMKFYLQLLSRIARCAYINIPFYAYRRIETSVSNRPNIQKIKDAFSMCQTHWEHSKNNPDKEITTYCQEKSILIYYTTLQTLSENPHYKDKYSIIKQLRINKIWRDTQIRYKQTESKLSNKVKIILFCYPIVACYILHYWTVIKNLFR